MALSTKDRDSLRQLLGSKFPKSDEAAKDFLGRVETAILAYRWEASTVGSVASSQKEFRADCRHVVRHTETLLRLLNQDGTFPVLIALELSPKPLRRGQGREEQVRYSIERVRARKAVLAGVREALTMLNAAARSGADAPVAWGENRGRGRPAGLAAAQVRLAVECCKALQSVGVRPRLTISKRIGEARANEAEYPCLLRWALEKAGRRTKATNRHVTGDVSGIAQAGLDEFRVRL